MKEMETYGLRMKKKLGNLKKLYIEKSLKKTRKRELLKILNEETKHWLYYANVDTALKNSVLIPNNMNYQSDYFVRLQEKAMLLMQGQYDEVEEYQVDQKVIQYKNSKLIPLYANITGILTRLRKNDLERLYEEYEIAVFGLKEAPFTQEEKEEKKTKISMLYEMLIMKLKRDMGKKKVKIELLEEKLVLIYNLMFMWRSYVDLLNTPFEVFQEELQGGTVE